MAATFTISLDKLLFHARHGIYKEEVLVGNEFEVNLSIELPAPETGSVTMSDTVNYVEVYTIISKIFASGKPLLESIAMEIANQLKVHFPAILSIQARVVKLHPPITGFQGSVSVTYNRQFK
jgi:7,8-dihydroneopterin aldolase/epimerase/oxygenase